MNSDESDWDSMSEAPPVASAQQGVELRYPPPTSNPTATSQVVYPPQKQPSKGPGPPQPQPRPKTQAAPPNPKPRPPSSKPPPEAKAHSKSKQSRPKEADKEPKKPIKQKKIVLTEKTSASLDNSFSDLNQERYEDSGLGSSPEKANSALRGLENQSYEGEDDEEEEGARVVTGGQKYRLPVPDERIALLPFEDMRTHYLQVCQPASSRLKQKHISSKTDTYLRWSTTTKVSWSTAFCPPWSIAAHEPRLSCLELSNFPSSSFSFSSDR